MKNAILGILLIFGSFQITILTVDAFFMEIEKQDAEDHELYVKHLKSGVAIKDLK